MNSEDGDLSFKVSKINNKLIRRAVIITTYPIIACIIIPLLSVYGWFLWVIGAQRKLLKSISTVW